MNMHLNIAFLQIAHHTLGEMKTGRRSCHRTLIMAIYRLVTHLVNVLAVAVKIWWNWNIAGNIYYLRKANIGIVPFKKNFKRITNLAHTGNI